MAQAPSLELEPLLSVGCGPCAGLWTPSGTAKRMRGSYARPITLEKVTHDCVWPIEQYSRHLPTKHIL